MLKRMVLLLVGAVLAAGTACAEPDDLFNFELSLAGYRLGMSYDEATAVRPFHLVRDLPVTANGELFFAGRVEQVFIDEVELSVEVHFRQERVQKIMLRFHPAQLDDMLRLLQERLGDGDNRSRTLQLASGRESRQVIHRWGFPQAELFLIGVSTNTEFATATLMTKRNVIPMPEGEGTTE